MEVLVLAPFAIEERARLEAAVGEFHFIYAADITPDTRNTLVRDAYKKAEVIIGEPDVNDIIPPKAPALRLVQMTWAGADRYTKADNFPEEVQLATASGAFGITISEHVIAGILSLYRNFPAYHKNQEAFIWQKLGTEKTIYGARVLILGMGNIGQALAKRFKAFDATVAGIRREQKLTPYFDEVHAVRELDEELGKADLVIGCMPDNDGSRGLMTEERFREMKPDAMFVNVGRGSLVHQGALESALQQKWIAGAVLDVFAQEPLDAGSPLWTMENVIITPHIAGASFGHTKITEELIADICAENLERYAAGRELRNVVRFTRGSGATEPGKGVL